MMVMARILPIPGMVSNSKGAIQLDHGLHFRFDGLNLLAQETNRFHLMKGRGDQMRTVKHLLDEIVPETDDGAGALLTPRLRAIML